MHAVAVDLAPAAVLVMRTSQVLVARIARTDVACADLARTRSPAVQAPSGVDCRRQPATDASPIEFAPPARCGVAFDARHRPRPLVPRLGFARRKRAKPNGRSRMLGKANANWWTTPIELVHWPRSRNQWPPLPALRRVRAVGGIRAWAEGAGRRASSLPDTTPIEGACVSQPELTSRKLRSTAPRSSEIAPTRSTTRESAPRLLEVDD